MNRGRSTELTLVALVLAVLGVIAITNGARLRAEGLVLIGAFSGAAIMVDLLWSRTLPGRPELRVTAPRDATVGERVPIRIAVAGRAGRFDVRVLDPPSEWRRVDGPGEGTLRVTPGRRGVVAALDLELRWSGPIGTCVRRRVVSVPLARPLEVGPRATAVPPRAGVRPGPSGSGVGRLGPASGESVRAVRPYFPGDQARLVHWPSSARSGALAVRELEPPTLPGLALVVDLSGPDPGAVEEAASRAAGLAGAALAAGIVVVLATREATGPVVGPVTGPRDVARRLARAVAGAPAPPPEGWTVERVAAR